MVSILNPSVLDRLLKKPLLRNSDSKTCISTTGQSLYSQGKFLAIFNFQVAVIFTIPVLLYALSPVDSPVFEQSLHKGPVPITLVSSIIIPARSKVVLMTQVPRSSRNALCIVALLSSDVSPSGLYPAYSVSIADHRFVPVSFVNTNNEACGLYQGQRIADFCPMNPQIRSDLPAIQGQALVEGAVNNVC